MLGEHVGLHPAQVESEERNVARTKTVQFMEGGLGGSKGELQSPSWSLHESFEVRRAGMDPPKFSHLLA